MYFLAVVLVLIQTGLRVSGGHVHDHGTALVDNYRYEEWSTWSSCYGPCGSSGIQRRTRVCHNIAGISGQLCEGACLNDFQTCSTDPCPVDGTWTTWSTWTTCSVTMGIGYQTRGRTCAGQAYGGDGCCGSDTDEKKCYAGPLTQGSCTDTNRNCGAWAALGFCRQAAVLEGCPGACGLCPT